MFVLSIPHEPTPPRDATFEPRVDTALDGSSEFGIGLGWSEIMAKFEAQEEASETLSKTPAASRMMSDATMDALPVLTDGDAPLVASAAVRGADGESSGPVMSETRPVDVRGARRAAVTLSAQIGTRPQNGLPDVDAASSPSLRTAARTPPSTEGPLPSVLGETSANVPKPETGSGLQGISPSPKREPSSLSPSRQDAPSGSHIITHGDPASIDDIGAVVAKIGAVANLTGSARDRVAEHGVMYGASHRPSDVFASSQASSPDMRSGAATRPNDSVGHVDRSRPNEPVEDVDRPRSKADIELRSRPEAASKAARSREVLAGGRPMSEGPSVVTSSAAPHDDPAPAASPPRTGPVGPRESDLGSLIERAAPPHSMPSQVEGTARVAVDVTLRSQANRPLPDEVAPDPRTPDVPTDMTGAAGVDPVKQSMPKLKTPPTLRWAPPLEGAPVAMDIDALEGPPLVDRAGAPQGIAPVEPRAQSVAPPAALSPPALARIASDIASHAPGEIDVTLSPKELGTLKFRMTLQDGGLVVLITADRAETVDLVRRHVTLLEEALAGQGFTGVDIGFSRGGHPRDQQPVPIDPSPVSIVEPNAPSPIRTGGDRWLDLRI